jgi:hypothetical protein
VVMAVHVSELSVALVAAVVQKRGSRFRVMIGSMVALSSACDGSKK